LAIQTEDHPMEYASFEGTIPKDEYGGGEVTIWDSGTYELQEWEDGKKVVAVLHGQDDGGLGGTRKFSLFNTGDHGPNDDPTKNWMIHLMKDSPGASSDKQPESQSESKDRTPAKTEPVELAPMLATLSNVETVERDEEDWAFEMKWDGIRAIATVEAATD